MDPTRANNPQNFNPNRHDRAMAADFLTTVSVLRSHPSDNEYEKAEILLVNHCPLGRN
jgi:hypothetical protein